MNTHLGTSRRQFLRASLLGGAATLVAPWSLTKSYGSEPGAPRGQIRSRVALTAGDDRADLAYRGLKSFEKTIARAIGSKRVIIKPNDVATHHQLAATHAANIEGILEFLASIGCKDMVIAESAGDGPTLEGFANYGYDKVAAKYGARLMDLDKEPSQIVYCFDETDFRPHPCRMSKVLLDPNNFILSAAKLKTHDRVVATLSLKNIVVGAGIKDAGFGWGPGAKPGARSDKPVIHGSGFRGINYNLYTLARRLHPHLAVIDGYRGMEGNGPVGGQPVEQHVCVVSQDWLAADRVGIELMGIDFANVGYLNFCGQTGMGETDLKRIEILGPPLKDHIRQYKLAHNINRQLIWKQRVRPV
jgi:uncharacterized protein (DUF362 family)